MRELAFLREFFSKRKNPAGRAIVKALKRTIEKDVQEVVEQYQHKHYLAFLLQRKRSDLKELRAHIERQQLVSEEKEWVVEDRRAAASNGQVEAKEELARAEQNLAAHHRALFEKEESMRSLANKEKDLAVALYTTEKRLFSNEATDLVGKLRTP